MDNPQKRKVWAATAPIESLLELRNPLKPQQVGLAWKRQEEEL